MSDRIDELEKTLAAQQAVIRELQQRLDGVEAGRDGSRPGSSSTADAGSRVTDRRGLLRNASAAAAGAVAGAIVLGQASPAAAAISETGNPAVLGTASPTNGVGVRGVSVSGTAVEGEATATSGINVTGVEGRSRSTSGTGVLGVADGTGTGTGTGVQGVTLVSGGAGVRGIEGSSNGVGVRGGAGSSTGIGVKGESNHGSGTVSGVEGEVVSTNGTGVFGRATAATGNTRGMQGIATSTSGIGVRGYASAPSGSTAGVSGEAISASGAGVSASSANGTGVSSFSNRTQLRMTGSPAAPPGVGLARVRGELVFDSSGDLWACVASGTPGTWRKLAGPSTSGALHALPTPVRVYDSRVGQSPATGPKSPLAANTPRTLDLKGSGSGVPAGATGVLVNLVATGTTTAVGGFMTIYRNGIAWPGTSNLNWSGPNQTSAVTTITAVDTNAICQLYAGSITDVVVDVLGYYR